MTRPYVILNAAMTLDGKIATREGDSRISCKEDLKRTHKLRAEVDAIMVGVGTVLIDNPSLTVRHVRGENPIRVIVDGFAKTPPDARVLDGSAPTIIALTAKANDRRKEKLRSVGAQLIVLGNNEVDLPELLKRLHDQGVKKLLLEGGSTLNWGMISQGLVDEIRVAVAPVVVGGENARTLVDGPGFKKIAESIKFELTSFERVGEELLLTYRAKGGKSAQKSR
jgi:2,5-diamino-6-(ribosylamino)-4(3H)-pyrimidinone 5'-phosphate reductase